VVAAADVSGAQVAAQLRELGLLHSLVHVEEDLNLVHCPDRLQRKVFRITRADADDDDLPMMVPSGSGGSVTSRP
jgi:hypothetical protein